jgi:hypothetical protein
VPKTQRLTDLLPEVYAARFGDGLVYHVLDAFGRELSSADDVIKRLLPSHWVDFAEGRGLDALASTFGEHRRVLADGSPEADDALRQRVKILVKRFTGGGSRIAVLGAVRSALGLPFLREDLKLPPALEALGDAVFSLVDLTEFSPVRTEVRALAANVRADGDMHRLDLDVDLPSVRAETPVIKLHVVQGVARNISVELQAAAVGVLAAPRLAVRAGESLLLKTDEHGAFTAQVLAAGGHRTVTTEFTALDGKAPQLPPVPGGTSVWVFRAGSGFAAPQWSAFDEDTFDLPVFGASMTWTLYQPLTLEVTVPYFLEDSVWRLCADYGYTGPIFTHEGLSRDRIQEVIDSTRAAGVRGRVSFALALPLEGAERHEASESLRTAGRFRFREEAAQQDRLTVGSVSTLGQTHEQDESLVIGANFDVSSYDDDHQGFLD